MIVLPEYRLGLVRDRDLLVSSLTRTLQPTNFSKGKQTSSNHNLSHMLSNFCSFNAVELPAANVNIFLWALFVIVLDLSFDRRMFYPLYFLKKKNERKNKK